MAVYDRIGEQILSFLEAEGMPVDEFFYANVVYCSLHAEDPVRSRAGGNATRIYLFAISE
eukprot:7547528-Pyramimonas_sp.AAC.1